LILNEDWTLTNFTTDLTQIITKINNTLNDDAKRNFLTTKRNTMGLTQGAFYKKLYPIANSLFGNDYSSNSNI